MADIAISDVTNGSVVNGEWSGTGVFDVLMSAVSKNIELQYTKGRIKGQDYANVYLGSLQSVLAQSIDYITREKLIEAQIDDTVKSTEVKEEQRKLTYTERVIKDKQCADLGLDNVYNKTKLDKETDAEYVYVPFYEEVV